MTYQWGTSSAPGFNAIQDGVTIDASKTDVDGTLSLVLTLEHVQLEGDGELTDQSIADLAGVVMDALKDNGFSNVTATDVATAYRQLEEVP